MTTTAALFKNTSQTKQERNLLPQDNFADTTLNTR